MLNAKETEIRTGMAEYADHLWITCRRYTAEMLKCRDGGPIEAANVTRELMRQAFQACEDAYQELDGAGEE